MKLWECNLIRLAVALLAASLIIAVVFSPLQPYSSFWTIVVSSPFIAAGLILIVLNRRCKGGGQISYDRSAQNIETMRRLEELQLVRWQSQKSSDQLGSKTGQ